MKTRNQLGWLRMLSAFFLLAFASLALVGCGPEDDSNSTPTKEPPKQTQPQFVERIELQPDTSDEFQRIYRSTPGGRLVSKQTDFRDGTTQIEFYRLDGSVKQVKEYHAHVGDRLKSVTDFDAAGKPVKKQGYRVNGNLESETEFLANGHEKITLYRIDGKRLHSVTMDAKDGTKETTYYRKDGKSLWAKAAWAGERSVVVEYFDDTGKHTHTLKKESNGKEITVFDDTGKALYVQRYSGYWSPYSYYSYSSYQLTDVDEFEDDGVSVKRRISIERYSNKRISKLDYFKDGELVREQELHYDGSIETDKTLKDDGTWDTVTHSQGEVEPDAVDDNMLEEPVADDPLTDNPNNYL